MKLFRILDPFTLTLITVVLLASFFPARGDFVPFIENLTTAAIALLFFMHGAKLSREAIIAGGGHWRLHLWVMCSTFVLFPILGVLFANWYSNGIEIPTDPGEAAKYWEKKLADAMKFASTDHLLFMNGCDHQPVQTDLTDAL